MKKQNTVIYLPTGDDASERWIIVREALEEAGISDIRPAPMPCQQYMPRQLRAPVIVRSVEV
jgi:hypothetical protein